MVSLPSGVVVVLAVLWAAPSFAFAPVLPSSVRGTFQGAATTHKENYPTVQTALFQKSNKKSDGCIDSCTDSSNDSDSNSYHRVWWDRLHHRWISVQRRLDTTAAAGIPDAQFAGGLFGTVRKTLGKIHDPKTYLALALVAALRYDWCFRNMFFWFGVGFCIKWYRARYVFKIPVWDRQPNWNNVITSKEQEKDLKAFTCKKCGSTIFIAKTREFFFEGSTGIGGLGCFACGAKGKENFVMDRERIVEDVADVDDYFDYEKPLDFVSRAERRKLLKEAKGDEQLANKLLIERTNAQAGVAQVEATSQSGGAAIGDSTETDTSTEQQVGESESSVQHVEAVTDKVELSDEPIVVEPKKEKNVPEKPSPTPSNSKIAEVSDDDLDVLGI